jgi:purine-binding chemotaxis protein CheW
MTRNESVADSLQYLTFFVAEEEYAIEVLGIREVVEAGPITRVPGAPCAVRGIVNLRGSVVPVVDLGVRLGGPPLTMTGRTCIIVIETLLEGERAVIGLLADAVNQVIELGSASIEPVPSFGMHVQIELLLGMGVVGDGFVLLLDVGRVLSASELLAATSIAPGGLPVGDDDDDDGDPADARDADGPDAGATA